MNSDHPSADRSPQPEGGTDPALADTVRERGAPLIEGIEAYLPGFARRAEATGGFAEAIAAALGYADADANLVREAAKLHDVGMIYVPLEIASSERASLSAEDAKALAAHHEAGARLAAGAGVPEVVTGWIRANAETWDGSGPAATGGEAIPVVSRMTRIASRYVRALMAQPGRGDVASGPAVAAIRALAGTELDPGLVETLTTIVTPARS